MCVSVLHMHQVAIMQYVNQQLVKLLVTNDSGLFVEFNKTFDRLKVLRVEANLFLSVKGQGSCRCILVLDDGDHGEERINCKIHFF